MPMDLNTPGGRYMAALLATGFFMPFLKVVEGICGLMLFSKRWTPLALLILAPIIIQIVLYALFLDPTGLVISALCAGLAGYLAWYHWDKYEGLFKA